MIIRKIKETDNSALASLIRKAFTEHDAPQQGTVYSDPTTNHLFALFQQDDAILWVAEEKDEVLGCCGIYPTNGLPARCAELVKFYLLATARGKGIGTALMNQCIESAKVLGYSELYLESLPHFQHAVHMYERLGFKHLDKPLGSSGHTTCNIWMLKKLYD